MVHWECGVSFVWLKSGAPRSRARLNRFQLREALMIPAYIPLHSQGLLKPRAAAALALMRECRLCPRACGVNRLEGEIGFCGVGRLARVASCSLHFGEEDCLVGQGGSGTVFFSGCNLGCVFCQNADISRCPESGAATPANDLAAIMLDLQAQGASNINLVTPSHVVPQILEALSLAVERGLHLPLVYNTGGYDSLEPLALLQGVVDIYMPDVKFWEPGVAARLCGAADYPEKARLALAAMHSQVGDLRFDERGLAERGLLVRHLVLPGGLAGTAEWMAFLAKELSARTYVNLMDQYHPCADASSHPGLDRMLTAGEFRRARQEAMASGITRFDERKRNFAERLMQRMLEGNSAGNDEP